MVRHHAPQFADPMLESYQAVVGFLTNEEVNVRRAAWHLLIYYWEIKEEDLYLYQVTANHDIDERVRELARKCVDRCLKINRTS